MPDAAGDWGGRLLIRDTVLHTLQLHSSPAYRGRIMALWVYVYIGTTRAGSISTGAIISAAGVRGALLTGAAACLVAAAIASRVHTPAHADAALTGLASA